MSGSASGSLLFGNGRVVTLDPDHPEVEAVLVTAGSIAACGALRDLRARAGSGAVFFDLDGAVLRPAYHDAHTHLADASAELAQLDLRDATTVAEATALIGLAVRTAPAGSWVRGFGWAEDTPGVSLTRADLDAAAPDRPVLIGRRDGHAVVANAAALRALGMSDAAHDGWLFEDDGARARAAAPAPARAERLRALEAALDRAASLGIARLEDVVDEHTLELYATLRDRGALPCRVGGWIPLDLAAEKAEDLRRPFPPGDPWIEVATRKVFLDGTLGARTAALGDPYADATGTSGELRVDPAELADRVRAADAAGWAVAFHAIGDAAVKLALDVLEALPSIERSRPHRIEHAQVVARADLPRFARAGAIASIQPAHHTLDAAFAPQRLGRRPDVVAYPAASLVRLGAIVAFGSDWPVGPLDPAASLRAILTRTDGEAVDSHDGLVAATQGPARAAGRPAAWGRIVAGAPADLVVVAADSVEVMATFAGGRKTSSGPRI